MKKLINKKSTPNINSETNRINRPQMRSPKLRITNNALEVGGIPTGMGIGAGAGSVPASLGAGASNAGTAVGRDKLLITGDDVLIEYVHRLMLAV